MDDFFQGQIGAIIQLDTEDELLSAASKLEIQYRKPDGTCGSWPGSADGRKIVYTTTSADDLDQDGRYRLQAYGEGEGWALHGSIAQLQVGKTLC